MRDDIRLDAGLLKEKADQPESKEAASAYTVANDKTRMENKFKNYSFFFGWGISIIFFSFTLCFMCKLVRCIQDSECRPAVVDVGVVLPVWAGFILLTAALGFSIALAVLRYSFPSESRNDRMHDSISTPQSKVIAELLDAFFSYFKKGK